MKYINLFYLMDEPSKNFVVVVKVSFEEMRNRVFEINQRRNRLDAVSFSLGRIVDFDLKF